MWNGISSSVTGGVVAITIVVLVVVAVVTILAMVQRAGERKRRLDLIESALRNPSMSPEAQRDLVRALQPPKWRVPFAIGWFGLFGGIAWMSCDPRGDAMVMAIVVTVMSFALLTLPFALRELDARRA